jgi:hypothetical protein
MQACCLPMYHPFRGYHTQLTCSILNGGGPDSDRTWEISGERRGKIEVEKRCGYLASATLLVEFLFHCFPVGNAENDRAKNWKDHVFSRLTCGDANDPPSLWHSCIFISFWASLRRIPILPEGIDCAVTKGKRP